MAEKGYVTIAFDPSFTGESSGEPRFIASSDLRNSLQITYASDVG